MSKLIVVVGATGAQGSSVVNTFLSYPGWKVRGITRDPSSAASQALTAKGAQMVQGDLDDKTTLISAFEGATAIFSNTDYFVHLFAAAASETLAGDRPPIVYAYDREVEQGMNIAEAAAAPSTLKTLQRFVLSSLSDAEKWSHGKYKGVYHYQSKQEIIRRTKIQFPEVAARSSTVQLGFYVTNWKIFPALAPQKQPDGTFEIRTSFPADYVNPFVVTLQDTGEFVKALIDLPVGTDLLGVSENMTWAEYARVWGQVMGVQTSFKHISMEEQFREVPEAFREEMIEAWSYVIEFGHTGGDSRVLRPSKSNIKIPLTSLGDYIKSEDWTSVL